MHIRMIGIDHSKASLQYREAFSFTKAGIKEALREIKSSFGVNGCILISTCNRTELWISQTDEAEVSCEKGNIEEKSPENILCKVKGLNKELYREYFVMRDNSEAMDHLLNLVCGFDSKIFGEDQIISQVREALQTARECQTADSSLEKVFQTALSAGKRVKTQVRMNMVNRSSANDTVDILREKIGDLKGVKCLVIGNGQMGKLVVNLLASHGACVSMTLRKKLHGCDEQESIIPEDCRMVPYDERLEALKENQVIISATLSPHYTLKMDDVRELFAGPYEDSERIERGRNMYYLFDLAVPRDIDPDVGKLPYAELYDIDSMNTEDARALNEENIVAATHILEEYKEELEKWFRFRQYVPQIQEISELVAEDAVRRFTARAEGGLPDLEQAAAEASRKATEKLVYGLKDQLTAELWEECLEALHKSAERATLKH